MNPFAKPRPNPKRKEARRTRDRVRLDREALAKLREDRYEFAGGKCETCGKPVPLEGPLTVRAHLSHNEHSARKSDEFHRVKIECFDCHIVEGHQGGKVCRRRPGKIMSITAAKAYWTGKVCFCDGSKRPQESFCPTCRGKVQPQTLYTLEKTDDQETYRETLATAELQILAADQKGTLWPTKQKPPSMIYAKGARK